MSSTPSLNYCIHCIVFLKLIRYHFTKVTSDVLSTAYNITTIKYVCLALISNLLMTICSYNGCNHQQGYRGNT